MDNVIAVHLQLRFSSDQPSESFDAAFLKFLDLFVDNFRDFIMHGGYGVGNNPACVKRLKVFKENLNPMNAQDQDELLSWIKQQQGVIVEQNRLADFEESWL